MIHHHRFGRLLGRLLPLVTALTIPLSGSLPMLGWSRVAMAQSPRSESEFREAQIEAQIEAQMELGFAVFQQLRQTQGNENLLLSPLSLSMALGMLYGGAEGATEEAMARWLGAESVEGLDGSYEQILDSLGELSGDVELAIANSIWSGGEGSLSSEFVNSRQRYYQAQMQAVDFSEPSQALGQIHRWISHQTQGRIAEILSAQDLNETTVAVVLNALYFSGDWTSSFPSENTEIRPFTRQDDSQVYVPMMQQDLSLVRGYQNSLFRAIELPYGESERFGMYVFIPQEDVSLEAFYEQLTVENWQDWLRRFEWNEAGATVVLPRFQITSEVNLRESMQALGLTEIFAPGADFSGLTNAAFWVTVMRQQLYLEVTEAGTEAAAVTGIGGTRSVAFSIVGDRPFVFAIRDNETGLLLFLGSVVDPSL
jgi:serpin B